MEVLNGKRVPALLTEQSGVCPVCVNHVRRCLSAAERDWCKLKLVLGEREASGSDKVTFTRSPAIPINIHADALMVELREVVGLAAKMVALECGVKRPRRASQYRGLVADVGLVGPRLDVLIGAKSRWFAVRDDEGRSVAELSGVDLVRQLVDVHAKVRSHTGESVRVRREPLPCPRCDTPRALVREVQDRRGYVSASDGSATPEVVRCVSCGEQWSEADYRWLSQLVLSEKEGRQVLELAQWLLAEARWERDVAAWLAAEREWALADIARTVGVESAAVLVEQVRRASAAVPV